MKLIKLLIEGETMSEYLSRLSEEERRKEERKLRIKQSRTDLDNSDLVTKMRVSHKMDPEKNSRSIVNAMLKLDSLSQGTNDPLGCVIASFRMLRSAQGKNDLGQQRARQIIESNSGLVVGGSGGWARVDSLVGEVLGVDDVSDLSTFNWQNIAPKDEAEELKQSGWMTKLVKAIENRYLVLASMPMNYIYGEGSGTGGHAFVVRGLRVGEEGISFLINDPLEKTDSIDADSFIEGMSGDTFPEQHIITAPTSESTKRKGIEIKRNNE